MKTLPPLGSRVTYKSKLYWAEGMILTGTVVTHYPKYEDLSAGDDEIVHGNLLPEDQWSIAVQLDEPPENYPYKSANVTTTIDNVELL